MIHLNKEQLSAVRCKDGPMLVLAGPGSGKTALLTEHIAYLIEERGVRSEEILVLTFSRKAAAEMSHRFDRRFKDIPHSVSFHTFHSFFYHILSIYRNITVSNILSDQERIAIIRHIGIKNHAREIIDLNWCKLMLDYISVYKNTGEISTSLDTEAKSQFPFLYEEYVRSCRVANKYDYDDMALCCVKLFTEDQDVLSAVQERYHYLLVDEFQDCNREQYDALGLIAGMNHNIFAVGDDDQSIYGFRGAYSGLLKQFLLDYPEAKSISLLRNYRCGSSVIEAADCLIKHNILRIPKPTQLACPSVGKGAVTVMYFADAYEEAEYVLNEIDRLVREKQIQFKDCAVLYRAEKCAAYFTECLKKRGMYTGKISTSTIYESEGVLDVMAYLSIARGNLCREDFYRIMNHPNRNLTRECFARDNMNRKEIMLYYEEDSMMKSVLETLFSDLDRLASYPPYAAIQYLFNKMGYGEYYRKQYERGCLGKDDFSLEALLDFMCTHSREYISIGQFILHMKDLSENEKHNTNLQNHITAEDNIHLMSVHAAKGLEYDTVFIIGLQQGLFPSNRAVTIMEMEEERRLMYVAMTRAKNRLYLCARGKERYGKHYSCYIEEIKTPVS